MTNLQVIEFTELYVCVEFSVSLIQLYLFFFSFYAGTVYCGLFLFHLTQDSIKNKKFRLFRSRLNKLIKKAIYVFSNKRFIDITNAYEREGKDKKL